MAKDIPIAIIGAGFSGIGMAIRLKQAGIHSFTIYEASDEVGGTWRDNSYPGCACDVPSHLYSFSFERNTDWTRKFSPQPEILEYLKRCVDKHDLREKIRFGTPIRGARFDEATATWTLTTEAGEAVEARAVVSGTGPLSQPAYPDIEGLERFEGTMFHSAEWDHDYDFEGKTVAVVGTGASAIQFVPQIAPKAAQLHLFQRTPPWVLPKPDRAFRALEKRLFARSRPLAWGYRALTYWTREIGGAGFVMNPKVLDFFSRFARRHIEREVRDPALREIVTPDYRMGCKRILISNDYYPALNRENVEVIPNGVKAITERGVIAADGTEREVDAIVFGTGFDVSAFLAKMDVHGRGGRELNDVWRDGAEAYYGMTVSGFPNLYILIGPNTGLGHNSMIFMVEAQIHYILQHIERLRREDLAWIDVKEPEQRDFNDRVQRRMQKTVWTTGCQSWYLDENGKNFTLWPGLTVEYWLRTRRVRWRDFEARRSLSPSRLRERAGGRDSGDPEPTHRSVSPS